MEKIILDKLKEIEKSENIKIIAAFESGSRAWGFASKDSDYDVRFIYIRKISEYVRLDKKSDFLEYPINDLLDIVGFDLDKTLKLVYKTNPSIFEWFKSPIVYIQTKASNELKNLLPKYYSRKKMIYHYLKMAQKNYNQYLESDLVSIKKYFYVLRPLLSAMWILKNNTQPPIVFRDLLALDIDSKIKAIINQLLIIKVETNEVDKIPEIKELNQYIVNEMKLIQESINNFKENIVLEWETLNSFFIKLVEGVTL